MAGAGYRRQAPMSGLHPRLARQLRRLGIGHDVLPDIRKWPALLARVSQAYAKAQRERVLLEFTLERSSRELRTLNDALQGERDSLEARVAQRTAELAASDARFRSFTSLGSDWYWEQDDQFRFTLISRDLVDVLGSTVQAHLGKRRWELPGLEEPKGGWAAHRAQLERHETFRDLLLTRTTPSGEITHVLVSGEPIFDATGAFTGYRGVGRDVSQQKVAEANISRLAHYDALTGLHNRAAFLERLEHALAVSQRTRMQLAVLFIDLDRFKDVNDAFGHLIGDEVLRIMAERISGSIRTADTAARLGGDEFIVLAETITDEVDVRDLAQRLLDVLSDTFAVKGQECRLGASIGIAMYPQDGSSAAQLLKQADAAMYRSKQAGRNGLAFFSDVDSRAPEERMVLSAGIRRALDADEFVLHYQPKVCVATGRMTGVEALVRWRHPERGLLLPDAFIPLAEDSGLIRYIGRWVLRRACAQAALWQNEDFGPVRVAINLSPLQFSDERFAVEIPHALAETGLPAELLEVEITESMMMEQPERAAARLVSIREMGVHVSIDDFGTGFSSLARLKKFPIESLKIDRSFIRDIATDPDDAAIVSAVIAMAHRLRLKVVAEGVETAGQLAFLRERRCDEIQGYYFSPAVAPEAIAAFARAHGVIRTAPVCVP